MKITNIRLERYKLQLEPPFHAAWDPVPRREFDATLVFVETDAGITGIGSGDSMDGFAGHEHLFIGKDPRAIEQHVRTIETINFHSGRFWPLEVALWDIIGKAADQPVAQLFGGAAQQIPAYASTGSLQSPAERVDSALAIAERGFRAIKIRIDRNDISSGIAAVSSVREAVGDRLDIMVDLNQSWRMAGDIQQPLEYVEVRRIIEWLRELDVFWVEEPLPYADAVGLRRLREETGVRIAAGEMHPSAPELLTYLEDDVLDVYQMDVVLAVGMARARTLAEVAHLKNRKFTPHSWTNGIGVLANLHVALGVGAGPYFEFPFDPPQWTPERRDFMLTEPVDIDSHGNLHLPQAPGLGIELDYEALERWKI